MKSKKHHPKLAGKTALAEAIKTNGETTRRIFAVPEPESPLSIRVEEVTPKLAAKWLESNSEEQRRINWNLVDAIANDIRAGQWRLTHQGILFNADGTLLDGQHRLHAIVRANTPVQMVVTHSQVATFGDPIDRIRPRSIAMLMGLNARDTACFNMLRMLEVGIELNTPMTVAEAEGVYERHHDELAILRTVPGWSTLRGPMAAACVWAMPCGQDKVTAFARKVITGEMISRGDPAYAWRSFAARRKGVRAWAVTLASLNCLRHALTDTKLTGVYTGEMGYRAFVSRRRHLRIHNTPDSKLVSGAGWTPTGENQ